MSIFSRVFIIYLLLLITWPCWNETEKSDPDVCEIHDPVSFDSQDIEFEYCSPFCSYVCCSNFEQVPLSLLVYPVPSFKILNNSTFINTPDLSASFWQPPRYWVKTV